MRWLGVVVYDAGSGPLLGCSSIERTEGEIRSTDYDHGDFETKMVEFFDDNASHEDKAHALALKMIEEEDMGEVVVLNTTGPKWEEVGHYLRAGRGRESFRSHCERNVRGELSDWETHNC